VGYHALLQEIFPTQGLKLGHLHCRQMTMYQIANNNKEINILKKLNIAKKKGDFWY